MHCEQELEYVDRFTYLGGIVSNDGGIQTKT